MYPHNQPRVVWGTRALATQTVTQVTVSLLDQPFRPPVSAFGHPNCQAPDTEAKLLNLKRKLSGSKVPFAHWIAPESEGFGAQAPIMSAWRVGNVESSSQCVAG